MNANYKIKKGLLISFLIVFSIFAIAASINLDTADLTVGGNTVINTSREATFTKATVDSLVLDGNDIDAGGTVDVTDNLTVTGDVTVDTDTFTVDTGDDFVGIGTASPYGPLHIYSGPADIAFLLLNNSASGSTDADGCIIMYDNTDLSIYNMESGGSISMTNGTDSLGLSGTGDVSATGFINAYDGFKDNGTAGIDKTFSFVDSESQTHSIVISGGIITQWDITP